MFPEMFLEIFPGAGNLMVGITGVNRIWKLLERFQLKFFPIITRKAKKMPQEGFFCLRDLPATP